MAKKKEEGAASETAIVKTDEGECQLPAWMLGEEFAGAGQEDIDERITPILHLVQPQSPEIRNGDAEMGDMFVRGVGHNLGKKVNVVLLMTHKEWVLWNDRKDGGGIIYRGSKSDMEKKYPGYTEWDGTGKDAVPPKANETRNFFMIEYDKKKDVLDPREIGPVICSMSKTNSKTGSDMLKAIKMAGGAKYQGKLPIFAMVFELSTEEKEDGENWWAEYKYRSLGVIQSKETMTALLNLHTQLKASYGDKVDTPEETQKAEASA